MGIPKWTDEDESRAQTAAAVRARVQQQEDATLVYQWSDDARRGPFDYEQSNRQVVAIVRDRLGTSASYQEHASEIGRLIRLREETLGRVNPPGQINRFAEAARSVQPSAFGQAPSSEAGQASRPPGTTGPSAPAPARQTPR